MIVAFTLIIIVVIGFIIVTRFVSSSIDANILSLLLTHEDVVTFCTSISLLLLLLSVLIVS